MERLAVIDRNVLRIGAAELLYSQDVPPRVAIQEAIRLAEASVARDDSNALALALLGHHRSYLFRDYDIAIALFERALDASPSNAGLEHDTLLGCGSVSRGTSRGGT